MKFKTLLWAFLLSPLTIFAQVETPDDLKVGDELPGPLGVYYSYSSAEAAFINVRIVNNRFRAYFLADDQKTIVEPDWSRAVIHYGNAVRKGLNRNTTVMALQSGAPYLLAVRFIPPPDRYWVQLVLQNKEDVEATNNYNQPEPEGAKSKAFSMEILNQLPQQDVNDQDPAVGDNIGGVPTSN